MIPNHSAAYGRPYTVVACRRGHLLLIVEKLVSLSILQRFEVVLIFGILIEAADTEHGRGVVLSEFGRQSGLVAAGGGALNIHFHAGLLGVHFGEFVPLIDNFRLVVQEIDLSFVVRGVGTAGAGRPSTWPTRRQRRCLS